MNFNKKYIYLLLSFLIISTKKLCNKQKKTINLSFSINNRFIDKLFVPLISLFNNSDYNTIYNIYILVGDNFNQNDLKILFNIEKIYFNFFIHIISLGNDFQDIYKNKFMDASTYYRLKLPHICTDINRIIHIDVDTIILKDLMELYTLNFENKYILGRLDKYTNELDKLNLYIKNYINCGVLLMDLFNLRKYGYVGKFMEYIKLHNNSLYLHNHDQTIINYICHDRIGILKPIYHHWPYKNIRKFLEDNKNLRIQYNPIDINNSFSNPFIIHFPGEFKFRESFKNLPYYNAFYKYIFLSVKIKLKLEKLK